MRCRRTKAARNKSITPSGPILRNLHHRAYTLHRSVQKAAIEFVAEISSCELEDWGPFDMGNRKWEMFKTVCRTCLTFKRD